MPARWIDALFSRLAAMYGKHWLDLWAGIPMDQVKATWADALGNHSGEAVKRALAHCTTEKVFPPTLPEFVALCRQFRAPPSVSGYLTPPVGRMPAEIKAKLDAFLAKVASH